MTTVAVFLISIAYSTIANIRLDVEWACQDHLKAIIFLSRRNRLLLLGDLGKHAPNKSVY